MQICAVFFVTTEKEISERIQVHNFLRNMKYRALSALFYMEEKRVIIEFPKIVHLKVVLFLSKRIHDK